MTKVNIKPNRLRMAIALSCITLSLAGCKASEEKEQGTTFTHSDNVFAETANWYTNPTWSKNASANGGAAIAYHSTAIWLHRIGEVETIEAGEVANIAWVEDGAGPLDGLGLRDHLKAAEDQGNALVQLVINNAPGKECTFVVSWGELPASNYGMAIYQTEYIDRIATIIKEFPHIPIAMTVEPYTLTELVKYSQDAPCQETDNNNPWGYTNAIRYAINTFSTYPSVHMYLDIGAANKLGWDEDLKLTTLFMRGVLTGFDEQLYQEVQSFAEAHEANDGSTGRYIGIEEIFIEPRKPEQGDTSPPGYSKIDGFSSNIAEYVPLEEPYLNDSSSPGSDTPLRSAYFYDWNPRADELSYTEDWLEAFREGNEKETAHLGVIIDTSRNGWGQAQKALKGTEITQNPEEVDSHRIDQREHRQNWCNQASGLGKRPQANPDGHNWVDAYVWIKQPGESDGLSVPGFKVEPGPFHSNRKHEPMCDPDKLSTPGQNSASTYKLNLGTGAMGGAPTVYQWFADGFTAHLQNAWPPICEGQGDQCEEKVPSRLLPR